VSCSIKKGRRREGRGRNLGVRSIYGKGAMRRELWIKVAEGRDVKENGGFQSIRERIPGDRERSNEGKKRGGGGEGVKDCTRAK